jgi:hypothetical protein
VGGHGYAHCVQSGLALHLRLIGEQTVDADALAQTLGQQYAGGGVQKLLFQRRAACVDDQNIHKNRLLCIMCVPTGGTTAIKAIILQRISFHNNFFQ